MSLLHVLCNAMKASQTHHGTSRTSWAVFVYLQRNHPIAAQWSSSMIPSSGIPGTGGGPGFNSRLSPFFSILVFFSNSINSFVYLPPSPFLKYVLVVIEDE